jgi:glycosyltransferase involved in cell wall biosynthesis
MKVVHLNTFSKSGGAAIAAGRIMDSLISVDPTLTLTFIHQEKGGFISDKLNFLRLATEKLMLWPLLKKKSDLFGFSLARLGKPLSTNRAIREADIIHLHWFNQSFLSIQELEKILDSGKKIVWTLHDMWAFTGGCFYSGGCKNYQENCADCPYLVSDRAARKLLTLKSSYLRNENLVLVSCSQWLGKLAAESRFILQENLKVIPNPISFDSLKRVSKEPLRQKYGFENDDFLILFSAAKLNDPRKGLNDLLKVLEATMAPIKLLLIGNEKVPLKISEKIHFRKLGYIEDSNLIDEYIQLADLLACPSHQDNLPNTVMESIKWGTPVLAYDIGGLSDMVEHQTNGYLASFEGDRISNLAEGLNWSLKNALNLNRKDISEKAKERFSYETVGKQYLSLYKEILA